MQPNKRCWNCRSHKTGCDRQRPACTNCLNRGEVCAGYGVKLSWPRDGDGRRAVVGKLETEVLARERALRFVRAGEWDVKVARGGGKGEFAGVWSNEVVMPRSLQAVPFGMGDLDPFLSSQGYNAVAQALTTIGNTMAGLYNLLVRMTLDTSAVSSIAARHALTTISFQLLQKPLRAKQHQLQALQALQATIDKPFPLDAEEAFQAMAASMLLNIYETMACDGSSLSWAIFFCGTKRLARTVHRSDDAHYDGDAALIFDWIFYHDTMYKFSVLHWQQKEEQQILLAGQKKIISKRAFSPERQVILPSLGCSLELLDVLCLLFDTVLPRDDERNKSMEHADQLRNIELRLQRLTQHENIVEEPVDESETTRVANVAELYRLAALLYLARIARNTPRTNPSVAALTSRCLSLLTGLPGGCERPWPLFVVAVEAVDEEQRRVVLDALDAALLTRPQGNLVALRRMVEAAWAMVDLSGGVDGMRVYDVVVSANRVPPSFT